MEIRKDDSQNMGIRLLKKGQNGILHAIFSRMGLFVVLLAAQALFLVSTYLWFREFRPHIISGLAVFTVMAAIISALTSRASLTVSMESNRGSLSSWRSRL